MAELSLIEAEAGAFACWFAESVVGFAHNVDFVVHLDHVADFVVYFDHLVDLVV